MVCWGRGCWRVYCQKSLPVLSIVPARAVVIRGLRIRRVLRSIVGIKLPVACGMPLTIVAHGEALSAVMGTEQAANYSRT